MGAIRTVLALAAVGLVAGCGAPPGNLPAPRPSATGPGPTDTGCHAVLCTRPVPTPSSTAPPETALPTYPSEDAYPVAPQAPATTCPADAPRGAAILAAAREAASGTLPSGIVVGTPRCSGDYLVADLTAPSVGTIMVVLHRTGSGWRGIAVGSYPCRQLTSAPTAARTLLNC